MIFLKFLKSLLGIVLSVPFGILGILGVVILIPVILLDKLILQLTGQSPLIMIQMKLTQKKGGVNNGRKNRINKR